MNRSDPATELICFVLCIIFATIVAELRLFDNPYFEYGFPIFICVTTLALHRHRYNKIMEEMKKQNEEDEV